VRLEDVRGIGARTAEKLREQGISTVEDLVTAEPADVAKMLGVSVYKAKQLINAAKEAMLEKQIMIKTAEELEEYILKNVERITTGCNALDDLLGGGIPTRAVTALAGRYASGKTEICLTAAAHVIHRGGYVGWVESEPSTFMPWRLREIAEARGLKYDPNKILVIPAEYVTSPSQQLLAYEAIWRKAREENLDLKLLVVDSFSSRIRAAYAGREMLSARSQETARHMGMLWTIAADRNAAVVITAQVYGIPELHGQAVAKAKYGAPYEVYGGHILLHGAAYILFLNQVGKELWEAHLVDAPDLPPQTIQFKITDRGVEDA